jgi:hypothetical protein
MHRHAEEESWWGRNWGWVVGCGCLAPILVVGGCIGLVYFSSLGWIKSTEVFGEALERVRAHPVVVEELGEPIETSAVGVRSSFNFTGSGGEAEAEMSIKGSRKSGRMHFAAEKRGDDWVLVELEVSVEGRDEPIDVLAAPADF